MLELCGVEQRLVKLSPLQIAQVRARHWQSLDRRDIDMPRRLAAWGGGT